MAHTLITRAEPHEIGDEHAAAHDRTIFGFWVYLMTDCILFATLFAVYAVLHNNTFGGPGGNELFNPSFALAETLILLTSTFTCGLAMLAAHKQKKGLTTLFFVITFLLGAAFLALELHEFNNLIQEGNSWRRSAFLSSFFTLVGCHGCHITFGLLWTLVMLVQIWQRGLIDSTLRRLTCLSLFWHFLDVIWVLIFTVVYLMGVI
jgi:cytochrome o ubiquinol oxidase subunit 3